MRMVVCALGAVALVVLGAAPAQANGRFPASDAIVFSPTDPNLIILRATFGLLVSHDSGTTWTWVCEDALGIPSTTAEDPAVALTANSSIVAGVHGGVDVSPDTGCNWAYVAGALAGQNVYDVVVRAANADVVFAGVSTFDPDAGSADAGEGGAAVSYENQLFQSTNDGADWAKLGLPVDPSLILTTFDVAPNDPNRLYIAGLNASANPITFRMMVSQNAGAEWAEVPLPLDPSTEQEPFIAAVDPTNPDRVYVRSIGSPSRLFVTENAGQSFQVIFSLMNDLAGFALSPDGSTIYAGSLKDGLFVGQPGGAAFQNVSRIQVGCLAARTGELWACSNEASGFVLGMSTDNGATFTPKLQLSGIDGPIACGAGATAAVCATSQSAFAGLCNALNDCYATGPLATEYDGGPPTPMATLCRSGPNCPCQTGADCFVDDAGADASTGSMSNGGDAGESRAAPPSRGGCGCSVPGGDGTVGLVVAGAIAAIAVRRRRR